MSWSDHIRKIGLKAYRSLHVIKRTIPESSSSNLRKKLYLSMVRSHLSYGSQLWRPLLTKDVLSLEKIQRRATKFILQDYNYDYKAILLSLNLLPIASWLELQDLLFVVKCLLDPPNNFNARDYICFSPTNTRSSTKNKLVHNFSRTNAGRHFYFCGIIRLWNAAPEIDLKKSFSSIKLQLNNFFWNNFRENLTQHDSCSFHLCCPCSKCYP